MQKKLPPLNALRAFEAGARHLSFTKAAAELNVTQAAVSHQVKALEEHLGYPLFKRMTRKLGLTEQGRMLFPVVSEAFMRIAETADDLRSAGDSRTLTISVTPAFGAKWLVYRLPRFWPSASVTAVGRGCPVSSCCASTTRRCAARHCSRASTR